MLHILNGGSTEETLKQTDVPGEYFSFRDALIDGPTPAHVDATGWRRVRAEHLASSYGPDLQECESGLAEQEQVLASSSSHDEVVLWFEHDLFCQLNLLYLLDWFSRANLGTTRLSLINIGEFPGRPGFRGLGELTAEELASLYPQRQPLTRTQLDIASNAWQSYCSPNPESIEQLLTIDTSVMPFLSTALSAHLQRFPSVRNGLGRIENRCLELVNSGTEKFSDLFPAFVKTEGVYGLGDAQVWSSLNELSNGKTPLLNSNAQDLTPEPVLAASFSITDAGREALRNQFDYIANNEIDFWLGGTHLHTGAPIWRWNENAGRLQLA